MSAIRPLTVRIAIGLVCAAMPAVSCRDESPPHAKVIVIGFDGMDPRLCERLMDAGKLPHLNRMREGGGYRPLGTTVPPQSPVAWATFITGANPGVHGIFDFIHRDPEQQCLPYYAVAETVDGEGGWEVKEHRIPLTFWPFHHTPPHTELRRGGTPFWDYLDAAGIPVWMYDIPANYPPSASPHGHVHCLAGMGVPDLLGGYGTYQFFSEETTVDREEAGGLRSPLVFQNDRARLSLVGPTHSLLKRPAATHAELVVYRHPTEAAARIDWQGNTVLLNEGEWSDWHRVDFELVMPPFLPGRSVGGICRFYLQEVRPNFRLYVSPINIDPAEPEGQKLSEPESFVTEIADSLGPFPTAGFQEDHKALSNGIFTDAEYKRQADYVLEKRLSLRDFALDHYKDGLLFFYFSSTDLQAHMFWWDSDDPHPVRTVEQARKYHNVIVDLYEQMDDVVGDITARYGGEATILVLSDHGFGNFRRQFNLNTWLRENGYIEPEDCRSLLNPRRGRLVDWRRTTAYGLGLNGLYVNLQGRELFGVVDPVDRDRLLDELAEKLLAVRDPISDRPVIAKVYRSDEIYSGPLASTAPDLIVGYHRGYRASWATTLGNLSADVITDNRSAWSADHCIAADQVPGVLFCNKPIRKVDPSLVDVAPTILETLGVTPPAAMEGNSVFRAAPAAGAPRK